MALEADPCSKAGGGTMIGGGTGSSSLGDCPGGCREFGGLTRTGFFGNRRLGPLPSSKLADAAWAAGIPGTCKIAPQFVHLAFIPAATSGVRTCWPQLEQRNSIAIGRRSCDRKEVPTREYPNCLRSAGQ